MKSIAPPFIPDLAGTDVAPLMRDAWNSLSGLAISPARLGEIQAEYLQNAAKLWNTQMSASAQAEPPPVADRRFASKAWASNPVSSFAAQMYLLNAQALTKLADSVEGDEKTKARIRFSVSQFVDALSPANFLALNADAQQKALATHGESLVNGLQQLMEDMRKGHVSQTDESAFEVGRNVATTEGDVVFENELFQLIEYKPLTAKVHERPMLFVPPCINKFYIMDLQPANSLIRYTVEQGHRLFVVSWRNPDDSLVNKTWDDYIEDAAIRAIDVVLDLTGATELNALGFCVGGTIVSTALAVLAARGRQPAHSLTLLTTLLDFSDTGILDVFVDENSVKLRDTTLGENAPGGPKLLKGQELATTFSFLRPNDLVWNYVVSNYLKGEAPPAFDLLYWNGDSTNLPGPMYCWYLRHTYLQDELKKPGALTVCGEKLDLSKVKVPVFLYASREDHIVPWQAAYLSTRIFPGKKTFVLGASGHIAGVINPPAAKKRNYWVNNKLVPKAADWFDGAQSVPGSWWPAWADWLKEQGGKTVPAPKVPGSRKYKPTEPAPGRYVKQKAT